MSFLDRKCAEKAFEALYERLYLKDTTKKLKLLWAKSQLDQIQIKKKKVNPKDENPKDEEVPDKVISTEDKTEKIPMRNKIEEKQPIIDPKQSE